MNSTLINEMPMNSPSQPGSLLTSLSSITNTNSNLFHDDDQHVTIDQCINETVANCCSNDQLSIDERPRTNEDINDNSSQQFEELKERNDKLQKDLDLEQIRVMTLLDSEEQQTAKHEQQLATLMQKIDHLQKEKETNEEKEAKLREITNSIKTVEYNHIEKDIIHHFLAPKHSLILHYLRSKETNVDPAFVDRILRMTFEERSSGYIVTLLAFKEHHHAFQQMLQRIISFANLIQSAKDFYQRQINRTIKSISKDILSQVKPQTQIWKEYSRIFLQALQQKNIESNQQFHDYIQDKIKSHIDSCLLGELIQPWILIRNETDHFIQTHSFIEQIQLIKQNSFNEFIERNISMQHFKFENEPTEKSIETLQHFIHKIKQEFRNDQKYEGNSLEHFNLIPTLLQRLMIYYSSFKTQLPLFQFSRDLLNKIDQNAVTTISTPTGSGKSTLLPALLIAEGYDKVIVTQPRRLPCQLLCKRVNETMMIDVGSNAAQLAGWAVSGTERNPDGKVLYLTDGLLKERLLYDQHFLTMQTQLNKSIVFFIDEVHERSVNIDLCLSLLAQLLTDKPQLKSKMKLIISSATLDSSVPDLFRKIPGSSLAQFEMSRIGTLYPIVKYHRPNENILDLVQELCKKRRRHDQILCFVSSVVEVNECCRLIGEISRGTIVAYPLIQSQHPNVQQSNIEHGFVFFSTTVAETSLTFPCLRYVIDTGMINTPVYDPESKRTILKKVRAAESTIKQRFGRLGRTQPGEYYSLYNFNVEDVHFPIPQICQSDITNLEFSLRKSPLRKGLNYLKSFLPNKPSQSMIDGSIEQLIELSILDKTSNDRFTKHGRDLCELPDLGSLAMSKCMLAALQKYDCGYDLICLSSILGVLNTTIIFKSIPQHLKSPDGDLMTLLNVMNEILLVKQSIANKQFILGNVCRAKGLGAIEHVLRQALRRYTTLEQFFNLSDRFRGSAQMKSGDWEMIAKALLAGYADNVFVSQRELHGRSLHFVRYNGQGENAVLDLQSTLTRPKQSPPVPLILARDIRHSSEVREKAILSFVGEIKAEWLEYPTERYFDLTNDEDIYLTGANKYTNAQSKFSHRIKMNKTNGKVSLKGSASVVLNAELHLRQQMVSDLTFSLKDLANTSTTHDNFTKNLESVMKMTRIFNPLIWRWKAQKQIEITINSNTATKTCEVNVKGRDSDNQQVKQEFVSFIGWLRYCAVIRHPNAGRRIFFHIQFSSVVSGVSPRVLRPQMRKTSQDIEERIARVTDSKRTTVDLYNGAQGAKATRESRMEVVAWMAICKNDCRLEGGFVRDWIVRHYTQRPTGKNNPKQWIETMTPVPAINKEVVPCDLDCHLPSHAYFDIHKFQDDLFRYGITCQVFRQDWRYVLLFDENEPTGPFTMDLIEPHVAVTHDRIDFDVSNLCVEKDYTHELGMRIDVTQKPYSIELETIVDNIKKKQFRILRPVDAQIEFRKTTMIKHRGWKEIGQPLLVIPEPHWKHHFVLVPLPRSAVLYTEISTKMTNAIPGARIISIELIRNPFLEETYEGMKKIIAKQCQGNNPNEQELFHGTKDQGIDGITEDGFDDRYFNTAGMYGLYIHFTLRSLL